MDLERWLVFAGVLTVVLVTPGPDFAVVVRHALAGWPAGARAAAGILTGLVVHTTAVALGLAAVLAARPELLGAIRLAGAAYLGVLGVRALHAAWRCPSGGVQRPASAHPFRDGVAGNIANPKALLFFLGLLPQFVDASGDVTSQVVLLAVTTIGLSAVWWTVVVALCHGVRRAVDGPRGRQVLDAVSGVVFVGLAAALVAG